jgi:hypothetical protein
MQPVDPKVQVDDSALTGQAQQKVNSGTSTRPIKELTYLSAK